MVCEDTILCINFNTVFSETIWKTRHVICTAGRQPVKSECNWRRHMYTAKSDDISTEDTPLRETGNSIVVRRKVTQSHEDTKT